MQPERGCHVPNVAVRAAGHMCSSSARQERHSRVQGTCACISFSLQLNYISLGPEETRDQKMTPSGLDVSLYPNNIPKILHPTKTPSPQSTRLVLKTLRDAVSSPSFDSSFQNVCISHLNVSGFILWQLTPVTSFPANGPARAKI